jgi:hypothetical protein
MTRNKIGWLLTVAGIAAKVDAAEVLFPASKLAFTISAEL